MNHATRKGECWRRAGRDLRATSPSSAGASLSSAAPSGRSLSIARLWVSTVTANMAVTYCATLLSPRWLAVQCTPKVRGGMTGGHFLYALFGVAAIPSTSAEVSTPPSGRPSAAGSATDRVLLGSSSLGSSRRDEWRPDSASCVSGENRIRSKRLSHTQASPCFSGDDSRDFPRSP